MSSEASLSKRIKRHVIGRSRPYFAATAPGFESVCFKELLALALPMENVSAIPGGVEFKGRLIDCYQANLHLRTANRILMRIDQFKASSFRQIEKKTAEIPWELYLPSKSSPQIHTTTKHCRLYHSDAIGQRLIKSISTHTIKGTYNGGQKEGIMSKARIFVRGVDDQFTISIDSSGENLYKRGLKMHPGQAPLRETIAAAALLQAGYRGTEPVIDPMCGTGTFSLEAALMAKNIPPGWFRDFAFMGWPSFQQKKWEYLKQQCQTHFASRQTPTIFASDKDPTACKLLTERLIENRLTDVIKVISQDFFDFLPRDLTDQTGLVAINPPYGRRLENRAKSDQLFIKICSRLKREYKGWKLILISPNKKLTQKVPFKLTKQPITHGGLRPVMMIGIIN
ncbi:23S rRNA (guanine(2445)-N(2))-methyltransferase (EC [Olavius sp. associated proteobacterium Delta 1]|nr:23S rRNA (guanine(2445)-N(2))-methyltransferase (EC [Olavius sp. associated proteobacterium Delta 1]